MKEKFYEKYIDKDEIYERIVYKILPKGDKLLLSNYLCFLINTFYIEEISNISKNDKEELIKSYLLFLLKGIY